MTSARRRVKSVLVTYEPSRAGGAALSSALDIARTAAATLTVVSVTQGRNGLTSARAAAGERRWPGTSRCACLRTSGSRRLRTRSVSRGMSANSPRADRNAKCWPKPPDSARQISSWCRGSEPSVFAAWSG